MISEEQKQNALKEFHSAVEFEDKLKKATLLNKIKNIQSFGDFRKKISRKIESIKRYKSFVINEWIVSLFYGKDIDTYFVFQTSPEDVKQLRVLLSSSKKLKMQSLKQSGFQAKGKRGTQQVDKKLYDLMNVNQTWFEIKRNVIYDNFIFKIKPILRDYLKSKK